MLISLYDVTDERYMGIRRYLILCIGLRVCCLRDSFRVWFVA